MDYQELLLQHLHLIDRVIRYVARRHHLSASDADEFASTVRYKLVDRDFAVFRKFQGRSNIGTYLTTVIERLYLDFCIARWGKWRPSATAKRLGEVAMRLEELMVRDGLSFDEAVGTLHTNHGVGETRDELHTMMLQLPVRIPRRFGGEDELSVAAMLGAIDPGFEHSYERALAERIEAALGRAIERLPALDQLILKLRYLDDLNVAAIARVLQMEAKPLYRRLEHVFGLLRDELHREHIDAADIERIVGHPALSLGRVLQDVTRDLLDKRATRPSNA